MSLVKTDTEADTRHMDERLKNWHPTEAEVDEIVRELRSLIRDLARRDAAKIDRSAAVRQPVAVA